MHLLLSHSKSRIVSACSPWNHGSTEWFNVQYDGEEDILTLNLYEDIEKGDLDIIT